MEVVVVVVGYALAVGAVVVWGLAVIPIKRARAPGRIGIMVSMPVGLLALVVTAVLTGALELPTVTGRDWLFIFLVGLCQFALGGVTYYEAVQHAGITVATPITRLMPMLVVLSAVVLGATPFSWVLLCAAALVVAGGVILSRGLNHKKHFHSRSEVRKGVVLALLTAVLWAAGNLSVDRVDDGVSRLVVTLFALTMGTVFYWLVMALTGRLGRLWTLTRRDIVCYGIHGVMSYAVAYVALFEAIRLLGVSRATVIVGTWPAAAVVVAVVVFREHMNRVIASGIALLIASAVLVALA